MIDSSTFEQALAAAWPRQTDGADDGGIEVIYRDGRLTARVDLWPVCCSSTSDWGPDPDPWALAADAVRYWFEVAANRIRWRGSRHAIDEAAWSIASKSYTHPQESSCSPIA